MHNAQTLSDFTENVTTMHELGGWS